MTETTAVAIQPKASIVGRMTVEQLRARLASTRDETGASLSQFLTFSGKTGKYFVKVDGDKNFIEPGTELAVNILDAKKGWTCWKNGEPVGEEPVSVFVDLPDKDSLPDHGPYDPPKPGEKQRDGWNNFISIPFKNLDTGVQYTLKVNSESARRAVGKLIDDLLAASLQGHDISTDVPVVKLGVKEFKSNGFDNSKPTFEIVRWLKNSISTAAIADGGASAEAATKEVVAEAAAAPAKGFMKSMLPKSKS